MADISYNRVTNDIEISGSGDLIFTSDTDVTESIKQRINARLLTFAGEWFLDGGANVGVQWVRDLLSLSPLSYKNADQLIRNTVERTAGIKSVISVEFDLEKSNRVLNATYVALTNQGATIQDNIQVG